MWKYSHILKEENKDIRTKCSSDMEDYSVELMNNILLFLSSECKSYFIPGHYYLYPAWTVENV